MLYKLIKIEKSLCSAGMIVSGTLLVALIALSGLNVVCRLVGYPISASYELSGLFGALLASLALADTQRKRGHVELDFFTRKYPGSIKRWIGAFNVFAGALLVIALGCQIANRATTLLQAGEVSETLKFPYPWLMFGTVFGLALLAASFLTDGLLLVFGHVDKQAYAQQRARMVNSIRGEIEPHQQEEDAL
jgi:TRAP-type C4-dicarboxylate transport system permease small subunit